MPNDTNLTSGLELIQATASSRYERSTLQYIIKIVKDLPDEEWQDIVDHLIYAYIKTKGDLPTPSQFIQAKNEVNAKKPTKIEYPDPFAGSDLIGYMEWAKGEKRPVEEYRAWKKQQSTRGG